ncbi:MAG: hypothetical protein E3K32_11875 [wastewater metagenome]|nr:hypothetical protein [Candidatus Loosdrechtia aerotolerans]
MIITSSKQQYNTKLLAYLHGLHKLRVSGCPDSAGQKVLMEEARRIKGKIDESLKRGCQR